MHTISTKSIQASSTQNSTNYTKLTTFRQLSSQKTKPNNIETYTTSREEISNTTLAYPTPTVTQKYTQAQRRQTHTQQQQTKSIGAKVDKPPPDEISGTSIGLQIVSKKSAG